MFESASGPGRPGRGGGDPFDGTLPRAAALTPRLAAVHASWLVLEAGRVHTMVDAYEAMLADEVAAGRTPQQGALQDRAFALHLGALVGMAPRTAMSLVHEARRLRDRLPATWARFTVGGFAWRTMQRVGDFAEGLTDAEVPSYDTHAAELAGTNLHHELPRKLTRLRDQISAEAAAARMETKRKHRHVEATPGMDGMGTLTFVGPTTDIGAALDLLERAAVHAAGQPDETRPVGALMFDVGMDLLLHGGALSPEHLADPGTPLERLGSIRVPDRKAINATILVTIPATTATGIGEEPGELVGFGGLDPAAAARIVAHTHAWTRVLVDPVDTAILAFDSTERHIPAGLRRLLQLRDGTCRGPGCTKAACRCDTDHAEPWAAGGHTATRNLSQLSRFCHQIKESGYWDVRLEPDGTQVWTSMWGTTITTSPDHPLAEPRPTAKPPTAEPAGPAPF